MKNVTQLLKQIAALTKANKILRQQLHDATENMEALNAGSIDALVVAHKKAVKIYTEPTADKTYRILIEKMHEGAVTLNKTGLILYCNKYFANMVGLPLEKVIGTTMSYFIDDASKHSFLVLCKQGWVDYSQNELYLLVKNSKSIPVLMSVNTLVLDNTQVLSIIITDLTLQKNRSAFKSLLIEKIIAAIDDMITADELIITNNSDYISAQLNYDYTYLSNVFSEVKGITIQQYIITRKIEKVKELILHGELNLTEIAYNMQYSSVAHLSHQFSKITGISPTAYRQRNGRD
jgi:PAS domain S-box-containing protein